MSDNSSSDPLIGMWFGSCRVERRLGAGGMSAIYLAQQERPRRLVAVKALRPHLLADARQWPLFLARFRREADATAALDHANIVPIYEFGEQDDLAYLIMPYLPDGSLATLLARQGPLPIPQALSYVDQIASALDYAHQHGIIHRDVKPSNLLLHPDGRLLLADFGIARPLDQRDLPAIAFAASAPGAPDAADDGNDAGLTVSGVTLGTPDYMAPEQIRGERVGPAADIYALGVVTYAMLAGHSPFGGAPTAQVLARQLHDAPPPLRLGRPDASARTEEVIFWALAKDAADRPLSAGAFAQALRESARNPLDALWKRAASPLGAAGPAMTLARFRGAGEASAGRPASHGQLLPGPDATLWDPAYHTQEAPAAQPWRAGVAGGAGGGAGGGAIGGGRAGGAPSRGVSAALIGAVVVALVVLLVMGAVVANALGASLGQAFLPGGAATRTLTTTITPTATATPSPTPSPTPPANWLAAQPTTLYLGCKGDKKTETVRLTNQGPSTVNWLAQLPGDPGMESGVTVSPSEGHLGAGQSVNINITNATALWVARQGQISFTPGDNDAGEPAVVSYSAQGCIGG